jgi:hypothetical protein
MWIGEGHGMVDVVGLGLGALAVEVHEHDLAPDVGHHHRIGRRRTDEAAAHNPDFVT